MELQQSPFGAAAPNTHDLHLVIVAFEVTNLRSRCREQFQRAGKGEIVACPDRWIERLLQRDHILQESSIGKGRGPEAADSEFVEIVIVAGIATHEARGPISRRI